MVAALKAEGARLVGKAGHRIGTVAVCAGSGSSLMARAAAEGAGLLVTGDMKYHDAVKAMEMGLAVLDIGHFAPEKFGMKRFAGRLTRRLEEKGWKVQVFNARESDPFAFLS